MTIEFFSSNMLALSLLYNTITCIAVRLQGYKYRIKMSLDRYFIWRRIPNILVWD